MSKIFYITNEIMYCYKFTEGMMLENSFFYDSYSVPIHIELCVIHAEILTIAHVLSTTHVHSRTFFRTEKRYFHRTTLLGLLF